MEIFFDTQYRKPKRFFSNVGSPIREIFGPAYDEKGRLILEKKGEEDFQEYIDSHAESVNIHTILKRYAAGDVDALRQRVNGFYGDVSEMPTSYAEVLNRMADGERFFNSLPIEKKEKFNFSFVQFLSSLGTPQFFEVFGIENSGSSVGKDVIEREENMSNE